MTSEAKGQLVPIGGGDPIPLVRQHLMIGRRDSCDIPLRFSNVSGQHCSLAFHDGVWEIRDLGSTNGIKVNGNRVQKKVLKPGDEVTIAKHRFTIEYAMEAGVGALEDSTIEDEVMGKSLMEKAGLTRPQRRKAERPPAADPESTLSSDEDED